MNDAGGVQFLQWCLPRLGLRWAGFRKVRRQVYGRIDARLREVGVCGLPEYRAYLERHEEEWRALDALCRIPISRFYRDKGVFQCLEQEVLPRLAEAVEARGGPELPGWSIGCAAGEEPYTVAILWALRLRPRFPGLRLAMLATDVDPMAIRRGERGCYRPGSLRDLPADLVAEAFAPSDGELCVKAEYRRAVRFAEQDIRATAPADQFRLILCRNVAFTYFADEVQRKTLRVIRDRLLPGGALVIGILESLPGGVPGFEAWARKAGVYRRVERG